MKIWIDLSNSPHPLLFAPVARRLEQLGHDVELTARDAAQTLQLARERWPSVEAIGGPSPPGRAAKLAAIAARVRDLRSWALRARPDVALSHNSYAQIAAARSLAIPAVTAMDYEHQPANHLAFRLANRILLPAVLPLEAVRGQGATPRKILRYEGLKEELYAGDFEPDPAVLERVGVARGEADAVVVLRAPPTGAAYHRFENPVYRAVIDRLGRDSHVRCIVLARFPEQRESLRGRSSGNIIVPDAAIDARSLMYYADLVVGAGGTMTREAAVLGAPAVSIFRGAPAAVDRWLERTGRMRRIGSADELGTLGRRLHDPVPVDVLRRRGAALTEVFAQAAIAGAPGS